MADPLILSPMARLLDDLPNARLLSTASPHVDLTWLPNASAVDIVVRYQPPASLVAEVLLLVDPVGAGLINLGPITAALAPPPESDRLVLLRIIMGTSPALALYDVRVAV